MRKKVVREEPYGKTNTTKVIYDDGSWGLRGNPSATKEENSSVANASESNAGSYLGYLRNKLESRGEIHSGESLSPQVLAAIEGMGGKVDPDKYGTLQNYVNRAGNDLDTEDPNAFRALGETFNANSDANDPQQLEEIYRDWLRAMRP